MKSYLRNLSAFNLVISITILIMVGLVLIAVDVSAARKLQYETKGSVLAKSYIPGSTSTVTTYVNGKVGVGTVHSSRKLKFIVKYSGTTDEIDVDNLDTFYKYSEGSTVIVQIYKGQIFGFKSLKVK